MTTEPPEAGQPFGGHRAGRTRANPFDAPIQQSHTQKLYERNEWLEFKVDPSEVAKHVNKIRAAGQYLKLGTEVRADKDSGRIAFRGVDYRPRGARAKSAPDQPAAQSAPSAPAASSTVTQAQAPTGNQPWAWEAPQPQG